MGLVNSISRSINYGVASTDQTIKKIVTNPSTAKKALQLAIKILAACDLYYTGVIHKHEVVQVMKGTTEIIEFYGTYKSLMYWANLFSKETLDQQALRDSIENVLCAPYEKNSQEEIKQIKLARKVFIDVMSRSNYYSKREVKEAIKSSLQSHGYSQVEARRITRQIQVQQKNALPSNYFIKLFIRQGS